MSPVPLQPKDVQVTITGITVRLQIPERAPDTSLAHLWQPERGREQWKKFAEATGLKKAGDRLSSDEE